jgi:leucyl/phenylalanyl-tRNA--protein transferase
MTLPPGGGVPVAIGGQITAESLLSACYRGVFCAPSDNPERISLNERSYKPDVQAGDILLLPGAAPYATVWWQPKERYVIPVSQIHLHRSVKSTIRRSSLVTTTDADFDGVISCCADQRTPRWITDEFINAIRILHRQRWIRTVEVWDDDRLVGGLFGFALEGTFIMASAFHRASNAAKIAIADLARRVEGGAITLLDTEIRSEYTVRMGARAMSRADYLEKAGAREVRGYVAYGSRSAAYLLAPPPGKKA